MFRLVFWLCMALILALFYLGDPGGPSTEAALEQTGGPAEQQLAATTTPAPIAHELVTIAATPPSPEPSIGGQAAQAEEKTKGTTKTLVTFAPAPAPTQISVSSRDAPVGYTTGLLDDAEIVEVTGNRVNLRQGPSTSARVVGALTRGTHAEIVSREGGWVELRTANGQQGYMSAKFVAPAR